jgi:hypothetical protein
LFRTPPPWSSPVENRGLDREIRDRVALLFFLSLPAVIGRLKQSGMFWTVRGANAILALRCCQISDKFENYWEAPRERT